MPENKHISLLFFKIYMKNTTNMLDDIGNIMWRANLCATFLGNLVYPTPASKMLHVP